MLDFPPAFGKREEKIRGIVKEETKIVREEVKEGNVIAIIALVISIISLVLLLL